MDRNKTSLTKNQLVAGREYLADFPGRDGPKLIEVTDWDNDGQLWWRFSERGGYPHSLKHMPPGTTFKEYGRHA